MNVKSAACGLDFGTSNSTIAGLCGGATQLFALENDKKTLPSSLFFNFEDGSTSYGRAALAAYIEGYEGRLMRGLKSTLGSSLIDEKTSIRGKSQTFKDIIGQFVKHVKATAEAAHGGELRDVVMGRPVFFVDDDPQADRIAQATLEQIARDQGFANIAFQFEPIAAALDYEQTVLAEEIVLIADIGGGTSDFSVVKVSSAGKAKKDRTDDILSNTGVHIGGTDFDRLLSMKTIMPLIGFNSQYRAAFGGKLLTVPNGYFVDLTTWHRINKLYTHDILRDLRDLEKHAVEPELIRRLRIIVERRQGHQIAIDVENTKIALSDADAATLNFSDIDLDLTVQIFREEFHRAIIRPLEAIGTAIAAALSAAGVGAADIDAVFLTGGSTALPAVRTAIVAMTPGAKIIDGDLFGSVGLGLGLDARRKFA